MRILFSGTNVPNEIEYLTENISAAGNRFQNNMLNYLRKADQEVVNLSFIAPPVENDCAKKLNDFNAAGTYEYILKQDFGSGPMGLIKSVRAYRKALEAKIAGMDAVICYNVNYAWLNLPELAGKHNVKSVLILADYSDTDSYNSISQKFYAKEMKRSIRGFDVVVGLSSAVESLLTPSQKYILMEGGISEDIYNAFELTESGNSDEFRIMYSGLLNSVTGVDELIYVMDKVMDAPAPKCNVRLVISGKGELEPAIKEKQKSRPWLNFLGHLPYNEYINELKKADLLVNPRNMSLPENRNNFPSKILDYLATGKPVLSTKFSGWERFEDYIEFQSIEKWADYLKELINNKSADPSIYSRNREFAGNFMWQNQIERLLNEVKK